MDFKGKFICERFFDVFDFFFFDCVDVELFSLRADYVGLVRLRR